MKKITDLICAKCGHLRVLDAGGRNYCRECMSAINTRNAARATASRKVRSGGGWAVKDTLVCQKGQTAIEMFDAMCEVNCIGRIIPRMNPNAGRLKAGESLYPRRGLL